MKSLKIGMWFLFFLAIAVVVIQIFTPQIVAAVPKDEKLSRISESLLDLENRILAYEAESSPCNVILGPCYAEQIGVADGFYNLSYVGFKFTETHCFLAYCRPSDTVIFVFTLRDMISPYEIYRFSSLFSATRTLAFTREILQKRFGLYHEKVKGTSYVEAYRKKKQEEADAELVSSLLDYEYSSIRPSLFLENLDTLASVSEHDISLKPLYRLQQQHPKILFVLAPTAKPGRKEKTAHYLILRKHLRKLLAESALPFVDFSDILRPQYFIDCYHPTQSGIDILKESIIERLSFTKTIPSLPRLSQSTLCSSQNIQAFDFRRKGQ